MRRPLVLAALVAISALLLTGPARAATATPITLDPSTQTARPAIAIDPSSGTAYIVWAANFNGDPIHYCVLPRGATACTTSFTLSPDATETSSGDDGPGVVLDQNGHVLVFARRIGAASRTYMYDMGVGGAPAAAPAPTIVGDISSSQVIAGPLQHDVTGVDSGSGTQVEAMPTDGGGASGRATVSDNAITNEATVAMFDNSTPMASWLENGNTYYAIYNSTHGTAFNLGANWFGPHILPGEDDPQLASNPVSGAYLLTSSEPDGTANSSVWEVRRISNFDGSTSAPIAATDVNNGAIRTYLSADAGGGLTAVWIRNSTGALMVSSATTAQSFTGPSTLVPADSSTESRTDLRAATASDHGGFAVWADSEHGLQVVPIPSGGAVADPPPPGQTTTSTPTTTTPPPPSNCLRTVTMMTGVVATAKGACFAQPNPKQKRYTSNATVDVNGIDFIPATAKQTVTIDDTAAAHPMVKADKGVVTKAGANVLEDKNAIAWDVSGHSSVDLTGTKIPIYDFLPTGDADITFGGGVATINVYLKLPAPFDSVTGQTTLTTSLVGGVVQDGGEIKAPDVHIGPFGLTGLDVKYAGGGSTFTGHATIELPPSGLSLSLTVGFTGGKLSLLEGTFTGLDEPLAPGLFINSVSLEYSSQGGFTIGGGGGFGIPSAEGPITIDANVPAHGFKFFIPSGESYADLSFHAALDLFGFDIGETDADFKTTGEFTFDSHVGIGTSLLGAHGEVKGAISLKQGAFYADGAFNICVLLCANADAVVSNIGMAGCITVNLFAVKVSLFLGVKWPFSLDAGFSCDMGAYIPAQFGGTGQQGDGGANDPKLLSGNTIQIPPDPIHSDPTQVSINVPGTGGVPGITVTDVTDPSAPSVLVQSGADVTQPVQGDHILLVPSPGTDSTRLIVFQDPGIQSGETLQITQNGGAPITAGVMQHGTRLGAHATSVATGISFAEPVPDTTVTGKLTGDPKQRKLSLSYKIGHLAGSGRSVLFTETGPGGVMKTIGHARSAHGKLSWQIFDGPAGRRKVQAVILTPDGLPYKTVTLATFKAPGHVVPGKPTKVKLTWKKGNKLMISWRGPAHAQDTLVEVSSPADGRKLEFDTRKHTLVYPHVSKKEPVKVTIIGLLKSGLRGKPATASR